MDQAELGSFKLNIDGSSKNGLIAGGGIIWDGNGVMVAAFSTFYGEGTNNLAEFLALKEGLPICYEMMKTYRNYFPDHHT